MHLGLKCETTWELFFFDLNMFVQRLCQAATGSPG